MTFPNDTPPPPARPEWAYFLDVDGTLIEIADRPEAVHVPEGLIGLLDRLHTATGGACALVSGRSVAGLDQLFAPLHLPASGLHGVEWRGADGRVHHAAPDDPETKDASLLERGLAAARMSLEGLLKRHPELALEDKGIALAVHYRAAPSLAAAVSAAAATIVGAHPGLVAQPGKMVVELKPAGIDKGHAVRRFMTDDAPFRDRRPVFLGDDLTDEYGFAAVNALDGISVCVGDRAPSCARWRLHSVDAALRWLQEAGKARIAHDVA